MGPSTWGTVDLFAICTGVMALLCGIAFNSQRRNIPQATVLLATGISLGPLLLIVIDPLAQYLGYPNRLIALVLSEGRATLWWACSVAVLYLLRDIFSSPA